MTDEFLSMLTDSVAVFARADPGRARRLRGTAPGFDRAAWRQMAEQGWLSIRIPEAQGGLGLGVDSAAAIAREMGRAALPEPFIAVGIMAATCLARAEDATRWQEARAGLMAGERIATVAWQAERGSLEVEVPAISAARDGEALLLNGTVRFVPVPSADAFIVYAKETAGAALYWMPRGQQGLEMEQEACADGSCLARLTLTDVRVDPSSRLAGSASAAAILRGAVDAGLVATAAELVGLMDGVLTMTLDYLRSRKQFGAPIGSFQALQHRAVDMWVQKQVAAAAVTAAARVLDDPRSSDLERAVAASGAKARAAQAAIPLCSQALQLHGAIGFADEYGLGIYFNRALTLSAWLGNAAQHRRRYCDLTWPQARAASESGA